VEFVHRHRQNLFVITSFINHDQTADRAATDNGTGDHRRRANHQNVHGIAVTGQGVRDEAVIAGIEHGGVQKAIHKDRPAVLVELIFDGLTPLRDFDKSVHVIGRVHANRDFGDVHGEMVFPGADNGVRARLLDQSGCRGKMS